MIGAAQGMGEAAYLASHTVLETLLFLSSDDYVAQEVGFYYRQARFGDRLSLDMVKEQGCLLPCRRVSITGR